MGSKKIHLKFYTILILFIIFSGSIFLSGMDSADALKAKNTKSPKNFGNATNNIVCGDKLCSEISQNVSDGGAKLLSTVPSVTVSNNDTFDLTASQITKNIDGKTLQMFGYNEQTPGPLLIVSQGDEITVNFTNNLDLPTTVHWHGLRLDSASDGVPGVSQNPVLPGETFQYYLKFPDTGTFFYHPHVKTEMQMDMGLYGNILVESKNSDNLPVDYEIPLFLDDISIVDDELQSFDPDITTHTLMGRFGNTMIANGDANLSLEFKQGDIVRFYLTNAANTRTFDFGIEQQKIKLIADDASEYEKQEFVDSVILASSERRTVDVLFEKPGKYDITHSTPDKTYVLGTISIIPSLNNIDSNFYSIKQNSDIIQEIDPFRKFFSDPPDLELEFDIKTMSMDDHSMSMGVHEKEIDEIEWEDEMPKMNAMSDDENTKWIIRDMNSGKEGFDIGYQANVGDVKKIRLYNNPESAHPMQHPIHLHGQRFLVLSEDGIPNDTLAWKDTVLVPTGKTVDILVDLSNPGNWVMHCHILEHAEAGMITEIIAN
ncbi:Multicopper oxidase mco protein [Marine Group I thaumarchaeote SCGC RSA3]|uniref:Multicopper oxidase mco protein n=3 Tax=Marine Group I TaxID=905826 RepID=A0A081RM73_9ARCH|nr:Multicopper oxidase mco protein [Marine Group I thaumarchaeote SCGC AAA799-N04]KFM15903.1 Multicopper oxidase mco protein [Marine Group I thaumarchaeote SCGC AAA799-D11]KFM17469.1 Multicopper oxidase mco protein [Marine Group I thaumarchaeote SCGC RSA3]